MFTTFLLKKYEKCRSVATITLHLNEPTRCHQISYEESTPLAETQRPFCVISYKNNDTEERTS
jgi:hypothetical protein